MAESPPQISLLLSDDSDDELTSSALSSFEGSPLKRKRTGESSLTEKRARQQPHGPSQDTQREIVLERILKQTFQHDGFRDQQKAAILSALDGNNTLVIFPTGAGKSLCFQVRSNCFFNPSHRSRLIVCN
jgi:ATP-dependent helicase YprA (DUF1998 family)